MDETQIQINWLSYTDEWGNQFPDGERYNLTYPEVYIPEGAFYVPLQVGGNDIPYSDFVCRLESTIGIYGTGLIDAIPDDSLKAQYQKEYNDGYMQNGINPAMWLGRACCTSHGRSRGTTRQGTVHPNGLCLLPPSLVADWR